MSSAYPHLLDLAAALRKARDDALLTQAELAATFGVSERTLQNWEAGVMPRPKHRRALLAWLAEQDGVAA